MDSRSPAKRGPKPKPGTREKLIQAGVQTIHASGYGGTSVQSIVEAADIPKGSFYNFFQSKEAFAAEVIDAYSNRGQERLRSFLLNPDATPRERLEAYFDDRIEAFRTSQYVRGCLMGNFSAEAADQSALIRDGLTKHFGAWCELLETCIAEAQSQREISGQFPASLLAKFLLNSWEGALLRMRAEKSDAPLLDFKEIVFKKLFERPVS
ncbi:TetR/AcrR family transcriptional regulator [Granulicella mallensis]|uniref:Transcriptional regulator, TetR family n=1 Tax=Granulicella mallensis (strain ATCC BAA-1857 / DSM 23137 / MP5ACTX8) TaxID=682795 RepID=G8NUY3_GRAMM|nr:TetR/AcrR family transcriptional regulator [Granulicella mallensis]AEU38753.1 transcriptional regulator, TetR family [Granulicella mallensis MP5ACTX8]